MKKKTFFIDNSVQAVLQVLYDKYLFHVIGKKKMNYLVIIIL